MNRTTITMDAHRPARMKRYAALLLTISLVAIGALTASPKLSVDSISNVKASHHIKDDLTDYNFGQGYIEASTDGGIFNFGTSPYDGSVESLGHGTAQAWFGGNVIGIAAASPSTGGGYWLASNNGVVCNFGAGNEVSGVWYSSTANWCYNELSGVTDIVGIAASKDGEGYLLVGADGGVFQFGDAPYESPNSIPAFGNGTAQTWLGAPAVGIAIAPPGSSQTGYWVMLANGDECNFGGVSVEIGGTWSGPGENWCWNTVSGVSDIVAISPTPDGQGQWLTGGDGGIFTFGDAPFAGSSGSTALHFPISGMTPTADGQGYQMVGLDGGVLQYGDAGYLGGLGIGGLTGFNYVSGIAADN